MALGKGKDDGNKPEKQSFGEITIGVDGQQDGLRVKVGHLHRLRRS